MSQKISVIIPAYNAEKYIDRCLNSIAAQTYGLENLEIIIIDDASTDCTLEHLKSFEHEHPDNTIIIACEENGRQGTARNIGLDYATGEYITFVDSDDMIDRTMLEKMYHAMEKYDCDVVECGYKLFHDEISASAYNDIEDSYYLDLTIQDNRKKFILSSTETAVWRRLYKRSFIESHHLRFVGQLFYQDVQFSGIAMFLLNTYYRINETLYYYYYNEEGTVYSTYKPEKVHQEVTVMEMLLAELLERNMLSDILKEYRTEFEAFCIVKSFIDPLVLISRSDLEIPELRKEIEFFKLHILDWFPNGMNNVILREQTGFISSALDLLTDK